MPGTCLDSIFRRQIEIWLWGVLRDGGVLSDPSWLGGLEGWQRFALSSGAVGSEDDCGVADAGGVRTGAGGAQRGGPAGHSGAILGAAHGHPSELQARLANVADTRAARRAGQDSICGRQGTLRRKALAWFTLTGALLASTDPLCPACLPTSRNTEVGFSNRKMYV